MNIPYDLYLALLLKKKTHKQTNRTTHNDDEIVARRDLQTENNLSQLFLAGFNLPKNTEKKQ